MGKKQWAAAVVHCLPNAVPGTAAAHLAGRVRVTGRWVRIRSDGTDGADETWISAAAVQRIVWAASDPS
ncbi:hypothetical protein PUR71_36010 [Streptomyces sp. SP17BM10]|uniref:hypothetical protein n=1 Tax=Streptomyces sp. SP17BM10 TaxID=3002530 RepID=UPI002E763AE0|nr:hypothetical protein [Streptomyces sp. SP17BM10]MEE1788263.1 hypothetical protein [Streptomyces sp. SP17BM10]